MTRRNRVLVAVLLVALPIVVQSIWFYRGRYASPDLPDIGDIRITLAPVDNRPVTEEPQAGQGRVLIDLSRINNLEVNDLNPLRDRLSARGVTIETFDGSGDPLADRLRGATALIVVAPTVGYEQEERDAIVDFVEDGGRLLLAADPTRPVPPPEEEQSLDFTSLLFPTSAIPAINSLANAFGVIYFDDYLYNLVENEGNYRNVRFAGLADNHPLTRDVEAVVFFAAHSMRTNGLSLVRGDADTRSALRGTEAGLTAAALAAGERVLALGDLTFLASPYHIAADNDRFLSNIADWLAAASREWSAEEFPFLFRGPDVDLVQTVGMSLDPRLVARTGRLQTEFDRAGLTLNLRDAADSNHDALFVGTFKNVDVVQAYLATAGITITLSGADREDRASDRPTATPVPDEVISPTPVSTVTESEPVTPTTSLTPTASLISTEPAARSDIKPSEGVIEITGLGTVPISDTMIFVVDNSADRVVLIALAADGEMAIKALDRLASHDFENCARGAHVTVCTTGEAQEESGLESDVGSRPGESATSGSGGRVLILVRDNGSDGKRTSAAELESILRDSYTVTVWSISLDGMPTSDDVSGYDVIIVDSGDYAFDAEDFDTLAAIAGLQGRVMFLGAQPLPLPGMENAPILDVEIADATHPIAAGFSQGDVIELLPSESGVPAVVIGPDTYDPSNADFFAVFKRGPDSPQAGAPALVAGINRSDEPLERAIVAAFALYQLPEDMQRTLMLNAVGWLLEK